MLTGAETISRWPASETKKKKKNLALRTHTHTHTHTHTLEIINQIYDAWEENTDE